MRRALIAVVLMSLIAVPAAMAFDGCSGTGATCAAPCSAPCLLPTEAVSEPTLGPVADLSLAMQGRISPTPLKAPDTPPKSLLY
jgi:hypothetical protein